VAGARFSTPVQTGPGAYAASYTMGTGSFPEAKRPGCGVDHPSPSSASTPPMGPRGLFWGELYFYLYPLSKGLVGSRSRSGRF
jgi:hypothetical protein